MANPLAFPTGRQAGINWSHIAATNLRFSGVNDGTGAGFRNLMTGGAGTLGASGRSFIMDSHLGPSFTTSASPGKVTYTGQPTTNDAAVTCAFTIRRVSAGNQDAFCSASANTSGFHAGLSASALLIQNASTFKTSSFNAPAGAPFFCIASTGAVATNFVGVNLATGQFFYSQTTALTGFTAPDGTYQIGNGAAHLSSAPVSAVMFSAQYMTLPEMLWWAQNPWSFWYPDVDLNDEVGLAAILAARASTMAMMGVG